MLGSVLGVIDAIFLKLLLAAKSGALSGVLIVAGAVVTVTAGGGVTTVATLDASHTPAIEAPAGPVADDPLDEEMPDEDDADGTDEVGPAEPVARAPETSCVTDAARVEARERVSSAFTRFRNELDELRAKHRSARAAETLANAEQMLRELADKTDLILAEMGECDTSQIVERAIGAMETVVNLARSAASATPTPTAKPKATPKPTAKPTAKATAKVTPKPTPKPPRCDDKLYASKLQMVAAYEKYHGLHDKLYYSVKRSASEATVRALLSHDRVIHETYNASKSKILSSGCSGDFGASLAHQAAATFERMYLSSAATVASEKR